jgi:DNA-binding NtrC family response regulator
LAGLLGESEAIEVLRTRVERLVRQHGASRRFPPILIQGETGTGKGLLARTLHRQANAVTGRS